MQIRVHLWAVHNNLLLPAERHLSAVMVLTTEPHGTSLNQGVCLLNKQLQQDLVYNNINNFVQQQFRGGTTHPHGRDCFYCWFLIVGIVEKYIRFGWDSLDLSSAASR